MSTKKPEIVAYMSPAYGEVVSQQDYAGWEHEALNYPDTQYGDLYKSKTLEYSEPLVCLSDYQRLQADHERLQAECEKLRTRKPHDPVLRAAIIAEMNRAKEAGEMPFGYCTWWFKFKLIAWTTKTIRKELERMEREGIVTADRSERNNTKWRLVENVHKV